MDYVDDDQQDLDTLRTSSIEECVEACDSNLACRGISLAGDKCSLKYSMKYK